MRRTMGCMLVLLTWTVSAQNEKTSPGFRTNTDLEQLFTRADAFAEEGRYDLASELWQKVIDDCEESVVTREEWNQRSFGSAASAQMFMLYKPMLNEIETQLSKLPEAGLNAYRLHADGEANAILAKAKGPAREEMLSQVVRRFFLSSAGDDAAYELAGLHMDRYEMVSAIFLLNRILSVYPDSDISKANMLLRLAVAQSRVGDVERALDSMARIETLKDEELPGKVIELVAKDLKTFAAKPRVENDKGSNLTLSGDLAVKWNQPFDVRLAPGLPLTFEVGSSMVGAKESRQKLVQRWIEGEWFPTGQMGFAKGLALFKADQRLIACSSETGEVQWMGHQNNFPLDRISQLAKNVAFQRQSIRNPVKNKGFTSAPEIQYFGDRLQTSFVVGEDVVFNLEGAPSYLQGGNVTKPARYIYNRRSSIRRDRDNYLAAYDLITGKLLWHRKPPLRHLNGVVEAEGAGVGVDPVPHVIARGGVIFGRNQVVQKSGPTFVGTPLPYARFLIVPVLDDGSLYLHALDQRSGDPVWQRFLCDEPDAFCSPYSPVQLALDGGEVYVATGAGLLVAVDAISGSLRWANHYPREAPKDIMNRSRTPVASTGRDWLQEQMIISGKQLILAATDSNSIIAFDRRNGKLMWESPQKPSSILSGTEDPTLYLMGVSQGSVIAAGTKVVRRYDLATGRITWVSKLPTNSFGRGLVTEQGIFIPLKREILELDPANGKIVKRYTVANQRDEPLGNLFYDGADLFMMGLRQIVKFSPLEKEIEAATRGSEGDSLEALQKQFRLKELSGDVEAAAGALEKLYTAYVVEQRFLAGAYVLLVGLEKMDLELRDSEQLGHLLQLERSHISELEAKGGDARRIRDVDRLRVRLEMQLELQSLLYPENERPLAPSNLGTRPLNQQKRKPIVPPIQGFKLDDFLEERDQ